MNIKDIWEIESEKKEQEWLKYLDNFYKVTFRCRITHKTVPRDFDCYIFANIKDLKKYCKKNNIRYDKFKYSYPNYFLLNEENIGNLIGQRINKVHLISSNMPKLVQNICMEAMKDGYDIEFTSTNLL